MTARRDLANRRRRLKNARENAINALNRTSEYNVDYIKKLEQHIEQIDNYLYNTYIGRSGTAKEREKRAKAAKYKTRGADKKIEQLNKLANKRTEKKYYERRIRQDISFTKFLKGRTANPKTSTIDKLFWSYTKQYWIGEATDSGRYAAIIRATKGARSIKQAYNMILREILRDNEFIIQKLWERDWATIKQLGYSDDFINEAKEYDARGELYKFIEEHFIRKA